MKKKVSLIMISSFTLLCFLPKMVDAASIINNNNVVISESDYANFSKIHTEGYIMTMTQEKYDYLKTLDYNTVRSDEKFIETTYNQTLNIASSREITEAEYNAAPTETNSNGVGTFTTGSDGIESQYKRLTLNLIDSGTFTSATVTCAWKAIPATRSFDVNGLRLQNYGIVQGSQQGIQIYQLNGKFDSVSYGPNGTNIKRFNDGFGISMNIVNSDIRSLQSTTESTLTPGVGGKAVYATYQHATANVSLEQSKNYTLGAAGLGGVFLWPYSVSQHYDGMGVVQVLG